MSLLIDDGRIDKFIANKDKDNEYKGNWKGSGEISSRKLPYKVDVFTLIFIVGIVVGGIGTLMGVLGLKEFPIIFVGVLVMISCLYLLKLRNERKWWGTGRWTENQGARELTIVDGHWNIAGLKGELSGTIKECK